MAQARTLLTPDERWQLYRQALQMMMTDLPWIPIVEDERVEGVSTRLNWSPRQQDQLYLEDFSLAS